MLTIYSSANDFRLNPDIIAGDVGEFATARRSEELERGASEFER